MSIDDPKLSEFYNLRITPQEKRLIERFNQIQRNFLATVLRKQFHRILTRCPICGEMVGQCKPACPSKEEPQTKNEPEATVVNSTGEPA